MSCCGQPCCLSSQARKRRHSFQSQGAGVEVPMPLSYAAKSLVHCAAVSSGKFATGRAAPLGMADSQQRTELVAITAERFGVARLDHLSQGSAMFRIGIVGKVLPD